MMRTLYKATFYIILLGISLLPPLVKGYDCSALVTSNTRCPPVAGPNRDYPNCLVPILSVSAFIQCADVQGPSAPEIRVLEILTDALQIPSCSPCALTNDIAEAARSSGPPGNFANYLCEQFRPVDAGMCCLQQCLGGNQREHSIEALCSGRVRDLTTAPQIQNCLSNAEDVSPTDDESGSSYSDSGAGSVYPSAVTTSSTDNEYPSRNDDPSSSAVAESSSDKLSSTRLFTLPTASAPATTSPSAPSSSATGIPNGGADSGRLAIHTDRVRRLAFAVLAMIAAF